MGGRRLLLRFEVQDENRGFVLAQTWSNPIELVELVVHLFLLLAAVYIRSMSRMLPSWCARRHDNALVYFLSVTLFFAFVNHVLMTCINWISFPAFRRSRVLDGSRLFPSIGRCIDTSWILRSLCSYDTTSINYGLIARTTTWAYLPIFEGRGTKNNPHPRHQTPIVSLNESRINHPKTKTNSPNSTSPSVPWKFPTNSPSANPQERWQLYITNLSASNYSSPPPPYTIFPRLPHHPLPTTIFSPKTQS